MTIWHFWSSNVDGSGRRFISLDGQELLPRKQLRAVYRSCAMTYVCHGGY